MSLFPFHVACLHQARRIFFLRSPEMKSPTAGDEGRGKWNQEAGKQGGTNAWVQYTNSTCIISDRK